MRSTFGGGIKYGGLIFGTGAAIFYIRKRRLPVGTVADAFAPGLAAGLAFGRIGCFLNGCCYGAICRPDAWYGVVFPPHSFAAQHHAALGLIEPGTASLPVYPAQLLASAAGMVLAILLLLFYRYRRFPGQVMLLFAMLYSLVRFGLEMIRDDTPRYFHASWGDGLTAGQIVSIFVFALSAGIMLYFSRHYGANQRIHG
jgi:phosphatidylglycerol---prolipoprotein diacylglyceryl transferase